MRTPTSETFGLSAGFARSPTSVTCPGLQRATQGHRPVFDMRWPARSSNEPRRVTDLGQVQLGRGCRRAKHPTHRQVTEVGDLARPVDGPSKSPRPQQVTEVGDLARPVDGRGSWRSSQRSLGARVEAPQLFAKEAARAGKGDLRAMPEKSPPLAPASLRHATGPSQPDAPSAPEAPRGAAACDLGRSRALRGPRVALLCQRGPASDGFDGGARLAGPPAPGAASRALSKAWAQGRGARSRATAGRSFVLTALDEAVTSRVLAAEDELRLRRALSDSREVARGIGPADSALAAAGSAVPMQVAEQERAGLSAIRTARSAMASSLAPFRRAAGRGWPLKIPPPAPRGGASGGRARASQGPRGEALEDHPNRGGRAPAPLGSRARRAADRRGIASAAAPPAMPDAAAAAGGGGGAPSGFAGGVCPLAVALAPRRPTCPAAALVPALLLGAPLSAGRRAALAPGAGSRTVGEMRPASCQPLIPKHFSPRPLARPVSAIAGPGELTAEGAVAPDGQVRGGAVGSLIQGAIREAGPGRNATRRKRVAAVAAVLDGLRRACLDGKSPPVLGRVRRGGRPELRRAFARAVSAGSPSGLPPAAQRRETSRECAALARLAGVRDAMRPPFFAPARERAGLVSQGRAAAAPNPADARAGAEPGPGGEDGAAAGGGERSGPPSGRGQRASAGGAGAQSLSAPAGRPSIGRVLDKLAGTPSAGVAALLGDQEADLAKRRSVLAVEAWQDREDDAAPLLDALTVNWKKFGVEGRILDLIDLRADVRGRLRAPWDPVFPDFEQTVGATPLHLAARRGLLEVSAALLRREADVDAQNQAGVTPLMVAVAFSRVEILDLLIEARASVSAADANGMTAVDWAVLEGEDGMLGRLLELEQAEDERRYELIKNSSIVLGTVGIVSAASKARARIDEEGASGGHASGPPPPPRAQGTLLHRRA
ncbi:unnamed protein product [Prorocentrum cordatum]|uniref:ANK_REP_REGION domain-containing protein n=1 Tax=Prorocentrum cordatum TaxID=2364126 RepID=A0ABN9VQF2_9DINO|nr:unnamed protein product [Polarella glacialis]